MTNLMKILDDHRAWLHGRCGQRANLSDANLSGANLRGANLSDADLYHSDLSGTVLDPAAVRRNGYTAITMAGLDLGGDGWVYGWRTRFSQHVGDSDCSPGSHHVASVLSCCAETECHPGIHPGIHLAGKRQLTAMGGCGYPADAEFVRVRARRADVHCVARKGARCRELWVQREDGSWPGE
jgi:uncharacterized protein YjbI with pentapeptide repeats